MTASVTPTPLLTAIFKPPASCTNIVTYDGNYFWQGELFELGDVNCYPASFSYARNKFYSPGVCPRGWHSASSVTGTGALVTISTESNALCCPTGFQAIEPSNGPSAEGNTIFCGSIIDRVLTNVFSTSTLDIGPLPEDYSLSTTTVNYATLDVRPTVWAEVIQVRWQPTDSDVIALQSEAASSLSSASSVSSALSTDTQIPSSTPSTPAPENPSQSEADALSTGAKVGIAIGAALLLIIGFLGIFFVRKQKKKRGSQDSAVPLSAQRYSDSKQTTKEYHHKNAEELDGRYTQTHHIPPPSERAELMG